VVQRMKSDSGDNSTGMPAIDVQGVTVRFGEVVAVRQVTLAVQPREVFGLLGPNGSGKTTLIRAICGLVPVASGSIRIFGRDTAHEAERLRTQIGYMSQRFSLYEDLTARENLEFYAGIYGLPAAMARTRMDELIALTSLGPYLQRRTGRLSGGTKQRLALACALLHRPRLLFLDEPTAGIDPVARRQLWDLLFQLPAAGITLFVTTHYMDEAERCTRVGYLYLGTLLALGTPKELKELPGVTPPGTRRLQIMAPDLADLLRQLRHKPGVYEATIFGQAVNVVVDARLSPADLGIAGMEVIPSPPSLEDVFVALSRQYEGNSGNPSGAPIAASGSPTVLRPP